MIEEAKGFPMAQGTVLQICIALVRRGEMLPQNDIVAIQGEGFAGDRYANGKGSYNQGHVGRRQVTLMHEAAFARQNVYTFPQSRRNLLIGGDSIELTWLFAKGLEFDVGGARLKPVGYCDPCHVPTQMAFKSRHASFRKLFWECGGIIAEVVRGGPIRVGDAVIAPDKGHGTTWEE